MSRRDVVGRRSTDGRSWFEGELSQAEADNWIVDERGFYICPKCAAKGLTIDNPNKAVRGFQTFIFCDRCNPQCFRLVEHRRGTFRSGKTGRRITDGRAWLEPATLEAIKANNWAYTADEKHYCHECVAQLPELAD